MLQTGHDRRGDGSQHALCAGGQERPGASYYGLADDDLLDHIAKDAERLEKEQA